jgi:hypothetical protein
MKWSSRRAKEVEREAKKEKKILNPYKYIDGFLLGILSSSNSNGLL